MPAVFCITLGIFSLVTTEILPIGLLTAIAREFGVSDGTAGLTMTLPGLLAAVAAPVVTTATGRFDRRVMLCALVLLLAFADFLAAAAPGYPVLLVSRVLVGLVIGAFWSIGAGLAPRLVAPERVGTAKAVIFSAVPLGSVLGVPAGTFIGELAGWRTAFTVLGVLTAALFLAMLACLPALPAREVTRAAVLGALLRRGSVLTGLAVTFLVVLAHFGAYTYVTPFLLEFTRLGSGAITVFLLVYGIAGIAGNFLAGSTVDERPRRTFLAVAALLAAATALLPVLGGGSVGALVLLALWGLAYGAVPVCSQTWFAKAAPEAPEAATVLFTASFQATIAAGAWLGGLVVDAFSPAAVMVSGGLVATVAVLFVARRPVNRPGVTPR
ncbi:MFS transporter [Amycolatopsis sp. YIM 10]|uniref:MFS transporter n=1 Tax=Amycolatopsis sp. YIM 10 TaxID=2653857 RepID=UPI0012907C29|nr:MFS transporter [Amycolatopsis sp. YIM 10]QFU90902.1 Purine ribonucleoside efflux pump NepI [Amycolatopsis sp. YIM 10]